MRQHDNKIYLASKSPRRRELLRQVGIEFDLLVLRDASPRGPDVTEILHDHESPEDYVARVSKEKAEFAWDTLMFRRLPPRPVLAADTIVVIDNQILGKPADEREAHATLAKLSGRTHTVFTSIAVHHQRTALQVTQRSEVSFTELSKEQIRYYCASAEPYDKAGGYGIQGSAAKFISHINGSYSGIMGLPIFETIQLLKQAGIQIP
jgi:septum formation protein